MDVTALPQALLVAVFALLPLHERLRCRLCVSRTWREVLRAPALWSILDFSAVPPSVISSAFLRAVVTHTAGGVCELRAWSAMPLADDALPLLLGFVAANTATLRHLDVTPVQRHEALGVTGGHFGAAELETLIRAAPHLQRLDASMTEVSAARVCAVLSGEPPFGPLRLRELVLPFGDADAPEEDTPAQSNLAERDVPALSRALAAAPHACDLRALVIRRRPGNTGAALAALSDSVAACTRLAALRFEACYLVGDCCAPLAAMVTRCDALEELVLDESGTYSLFHPLQLVPSDAVYEAHGAQRADFAALCAALRSRPKLRAFALSGVSLAGAAVATRALVSALGACPHLEELRFANVRFTDDGDDGEIGDALCASLAELLISSSSIAVLRLINCWLTDAAMEPVLAALAHAPRLRCLDWREVGAIVDDDDLTAGNNMSFRFDVAPCEPAAYEHALRIALRPCAALVELTLPRECALVHASSALVRANAEAAAAETALRQFFSTGGSDM